jgi:DNA-binding IclR family transcriptional regulator
MTEKTPVKPEELLARLRKIRKQGYEISDGDFTVGIAAIGAPVIDFSGKVRAALSISGTCPAILGDKQRMVDLVVESAAQVSHGLGHRPAEDKRESSRAGVH